MTESGAPALEEYSIVPTIRRFAFAMTSSSMAGARYDSKSAKRDPRPTRVTASSLAC